MTFGSKRTAVPLRDTVLIWGSTSQLVIRKESRTAYSGRIERKEVCSERTPAPNPHHNPTRSPQLFQQNRVQTQPLQTIRSQSEASLGASEPDALTARDGDHRGW